MIAPNIKHVQYAETFLESLVFGVGLNETSRAL